MKNVQIFIKNVYTNYFGSIFLRQTPWVLMCIKYSSVTRIKCPKFAMYKVEKNEIYGNGGPFIEHGSHWIIVFILIFKSEKTNFKHIQNLEGICFISQGKEG